MGNQRLKRHLTIVAHGADTVELRYGTWNPVSVTLTDEAGSGHLLRLLRRLDGDQSVAEIADAEQVARGEVEALIDDLMQLELVESESGHALDRYLDDIAGNLLPYRHRNGDDRTACRVIVVGDEPLARRVADLLSSSLEDGGVQVADGSVRPSLIRLARSSLSDGLAFEDEVAQFAYWAGRLVVFATSTVNPLEMRGMNRVSLYHRIPWIHAAVDGPFLLVGPTVIPYRSACFECLETRVLMNLREAASYQRYKDALIEGRATGMTSRLDAVIEAQLASLTAFEALNFQLTGATFSVGKVLAIYLPTMEFTWNEVLRLPGCTACGSRPELGSELHFDLRGLLGSET